MRRTNIIHNIALLLTVILLITACEKEESLLFNDKDAFIAFEEDNFRVLENNTNILNIPLYIAQTNSQGKVKYVIETEGLDKPPAVEGVDFVIISEDRAVTFTDSHLENISIDILDNELIDGTKQFRIKLVEEGSSLPVGMAGDKGVSCLVTISDNEHAFAEMFGIYSVTENTVEPAEYNYEVYISGHDDPDKLILRGLWGVQQDITLQLDPESDEVIIIPDQQFYNLNYGSYGNVDLLVRAWYKNDNDEVVRTPTVYGTYDKEAGIIEFPDGYIVDFSRASDENIIGKSTQGMKQTYCIMTKN